MDLIYLVKNELKLENINNLLSISDLTIYQNTVIKRTRRKLNKLKKR